MKTNRHASVHLDPFEVRAVFVTIPCRDKGDHDGFLGCAPPPSPIPAETNKVGQAQSGAAHTHSKARVENLWVSTVAHRFAVCKNREKQEEGPLPLAWSKKASAALGSRGAGGWTRAAG